MIRCGANCFFFEYLPFLEGVQSAGKRTISHMSFLPLKQWRKIYQVYQLPLNILLPLTKSLYISKWFFLYTKLAIKYFSGKKKCILNVSQPTVFNPLSANHNWQTTFSKHVVFFIFFRGNNAWHYMWIVCLADDSHVMSNIIFSDK